jgi:hypothetical protein
MSRIFKCFVITPFGNSGGTKFQREIAGHVSRFETVVLRAAEERCKAWGFDVRFELGRDEKQSRRDIMRKVAGAIDGADAVLALILYDNANVFLEIGWTYGLWKNPVFVVRDRAKIPSDLKGQEYVGYHRRAVDCGDVELPPAVAKERQALIDEIAERVVALVSGHRRARTPIVGEGLISQGLIDVYDRFQRITYAELSSILRAAEKEITICVPRGDDIRNISFEMTTPDGTRGTIFLPQLLLERARAGVRVTIIMLDWDNYSESYLTNANPKSVQEVKAGIEAAFTETWGSLKQLFDRAKRLDPDGLAAAGDFRVILVEKRYIPYRITLTDKRALFTFRFFAEDRNSLLCLDAPALTDETDARDMPLYRRIKTDIDLLVSENESWSRKRFEEKFPAERRTG